LLGFELSQNPFLPCPSWRQLADLPFSERLAALRQPEVRARLIGETPTDRALAYRLRSWERIFPFGDPPNYEPKPSESIAALARERGMPPAELAYDSMLAGDGRNILYRPLTNYAGGNLDAVREMLAHADTLIGLGDGGAHVGIICDATDMTHALTHWTRDRPAGGRFPLAWMVKRLTSDNARAIGLNDRGVIAAGAKADINLIDYDRLRLRRPEIVYDLPGGGKRLMQRSEGYVATIVSGVPVYRDGRPTGELPGRLVRGHQALA
jgi:N-acyl-D-aspartate/D-glutamate deacylase